MKLLAAILFVTLSVQTIHANDFYEMNQFSKMDTFYSNEIGSMVTSFEDVVKNKKANLGEPYDMIEGKIQAAILNDIEKGIEQLKETSTSSNLSDEDLEKAESKIKMLTSLLNEV